MNEITEAMVDAYLTAQRRTVEEADQFGRPNIGGLHTNTVRAATKNGLAAALAVAPAQPTEPLGGKFQRVLDENLRDLYDETTPAEPITSGVADGAVWVRYDLTDSLKEQAIKDRLIALGWTPPTPQADSQPAPAVGTIAHVGTGKTTLARAIASALRAASTPVDSVAAPAGEVDDDVDAIALARYKVVPAHESMFHRFAVVAGGGKQQLYLGREVECENMARKFAGAFLDGAFYQSNIAPTQAADSVLEDAARYRWLAKEHGGLLLRHFPAMRPYLDASEVIDEAIDAARKQGASHESST